MRAQIMHWVKANKLAVGLAAGAFAGGLGLMSLVHAQGVTHNVSDKCYDKLITVFKPVEVGALIDGYLAKKPVAGKTTTAEKFINDARALSQYKIGTLTPPGDDAVHHHIAVGEHIIEGFCGYTKPKKK